MRIRIMSACTPSSSCCGPRPSPTTAPLLNDAVQDRFLGPIRAWIGGEQAEARARIVASIFIGLLVERLIRDEPLAENEREAFIERTAALLQSLVDNNDSTRTGRENGMADGNITKDVMYDAVAPDDFESMIELDRYEKRSTAFDKIISATHDHFWDPLDKKYIDFDEPFDIGTSRCMPDDQIFAAADPLCPRASGEDRPEGQVRQRDARCGRSPRSCTASRAR